MRPQDDGRQDNVIRPRIDQSDHKNENLQAISQDNLATFFAMHRHGGSGSVDGNLLYGPYFINDTVNGHTYQITCTNGALVLTVVK